MLSKYNIEYAVPFRTGILMNHHQTDDPVAAEQFLAELMEHGYKVREIKHEGMTLSPKEFNRMVKSAANMLVSQRICAALDIKPEEERFRFGFAA
jgi:hypothetical protein